MADYELLSPDKLQLDAENPRFGLAENFSETDALEYLFKRCDVRELWHSIIENGFLRFEPMVAFQPDPKVEKYIVVEGNRRLAAVKTLLDPSLIGNFSSTKVPVVPDEHLDSLKNLPVTLINAREDADEYIGFRHVNGARTWDPLPKARYGLRLLEKLRKDHNGSDKDRIQILSRQIGDNPTQITRNLFSYKVLQQAKELGFLAEDFLEREKNDFSHLYSILSNPGTRGYIGLGEAAISSDQILDNPIPETHLKQFRHLIVWLFGSPDGETQSIILSQGSDRPALQKVIAAEAALKHLETTGDFEYAKQLCGIDKEEWVKKVFNLERDAQVVFSSSSDIVKDLNNDDKKQVTDKVENAVGKLQNVIRLIS